MAAPCLPPLLPEGKKKKGKEEKKRRGKTATRPARPTGWHSGVSEVQLNFCQHQGERKKKGKGRGGKEDTVHAWTLARPSIHSRLYPKRKKGGKKKKRRKGKKKQTSPLRQQPVMA